MIREIFKMLNQYAVDIPTLPVNQCFSHLIQILALGMPSTHMVYRETFLQIQQRLLQHLIRKSRNHGDLMYQNTRHHM